MKKKRFDSRVSGFIELLERIPEMVGGAVGMRAVLSSQLDAALEDKGKFTNPAMTEAIEKEIAGLRQSLSGLGPKS